MAPRPGARTRSRSRLVRGRRASSWIAGVATAAVLATVGVTVTPTLVSADTSHASSAFAPVAHYRAGRSAYRSHSGRRWQPDSSLHPSGAVVVRHTVRPGALYRLARVGASHYRIPVARAGRYRVALGYLVCSGKRCASRHAVTVRTMASRGTFTVTVPSAARAHGVTTVVVSRLVRATGATTAADSRPGSIQLLQPQNVFGATSVWRQNISTAPLAANSAAQVADLAHQAAEYYNGNAAFNITQYDTVWYNVGPHLHTTRITFDNCQNKSYVPAGLYGPGGQFDNVPVPARAVASTGTDAEISIYRSSTDQFWDFWQFGRNADGKGYHACWGGRIDHVSTSPGYFTGGFGATATGLASEAGDVSITDVRRGYIDHAISLQIPSPANWDDVSWPAQRSDGWQPDSPNAPAEGTRLRLDPSIDVDALHLNPIAAMIARAAQKYGFIITDRSGCVSVEGEDGGPYQRARGVNPWTALLGGTPPYLVMQNFPWQDLQALPNNYGEPN